MIKLNSATPVFIPLLTLSTGFVLGRFTSPTRKLVETHFKAQQAQVKEKEIERQAEEKNEHSTGLKTIYKRVYYCPNGNIKEEVHYEKNLATQHHSRIQNSTQQYQTEKITAVATQSRIEIQSDTRWNLGLFYPPQINYKLSDLSVMLSYRIIGPFSIAAQSDIQFQHPTIGIIFSF